MNIYIINLKKRKDRWDKINQKFGNYFNLIRVEAIEDNVNGAIGCFKSHQKCISIGKNNNLKKILVMEDDCDVMNVNIEEFQCVINNLDIYLSKLENWKIFYGAGNKIKINNIIKTNPPEEFVYVNSNDNIFRIYETNFLKTAHFVWYNNKIYDWILNLNSELDYPIDKVWHGKFNCLVIIPFISTQYEDYSDIENKKCSYTNSLKRYERRLLTNLDKFK
jgi:GR25 family glycosyltransferase involved in LPS biosynthesis